MDYADFDLGQCSRGQMTEITLASGAKLRLLDLTSCSNYGREERYQYISRVAKQPVRLHLPKRWHVAVDTQGLKGSTCSSIRKLPRALSDLHEAQSSVSSMVSDIAPPAKSTLRDSPMPSVHLARVRASDP
ncbi:DUF1883 domain-containing protein [Mesorhizobium sp. LNHC252B00]|uniref:DUF1883 domain-containing protein n=1 Tax=Mesorhizobium sp. LNHC252B00 TaxID=1287252 RepID=UPI000A05B9D9|nr:DUF1883 domain-containing protein [Mesorhizobium sp. LNHC252B00]